MSAVTNETDETDCVVVTEISVDKDEGGEITFEFNGKRLTVSVFSSHSSHSIEDRLVSLLVKLPTTTSRTYTMIRWVRSSTSYSMLEWPSSIG